MKYTIATVAAFATMALAQPAFTNTKFDLTEGKPYTITFTGCDSGCTIVLQNGESTDLKDYKTLTSMSYTNIALCSSFILIRHRLR
jgi:type 1 fimbria pilin